MRTQLAAAALAVCTLAGCGGEKTLACESTERYSAATSAPPVRIPDDLSPPDERDSLRLPDATAGSAPQSRPCLENPPGFFAEGAPGGPRLGAPAAPQSGAAPEAVEPPADDPERRIDN